MLLKLGQLFLLTMLKWVPVTSKVLPRVTDGGNDLKKGKQLPIYFISIRGQPTRGYTLDVARRANNFSP